MRESGFYPPGAEFDPRAPYNQEDDEIVCSNCGDVNPAGTSSTDGEVMEGIEHEEWFICGNCEAEAYGMVLSDYKKDEYEDAMERKAEEMRDRQKEGW